MPYLERPHHRLHYRVDASGHDKAWLVFCNSLGTDLAMWDRQAEALKEQFHILRYDRRGHGLSSSPPPPFSMADLGADVLHLMDHLGIERAHFCGLSIGGLVGQWLALNAAHRFDKMVLCATAARIGTTQSWTERMKAVSALGLTPLLAGTVERWFTPAFVAEAPDVIEACVAAFQATSIDGYVGGCAALADADFHESLSSISCPLLAISGADDPVCPPSDLERIARGVANGCHLSLPGRHIVNIESAERFNQALSGFLGTETE
ncbi:3-oxoadipate enol-lactonase [Rhizobium rhizosphaerae]|uniref:3-oxoadipate enol-lactonase n=1 Tax=Xaviernesmea rhizosphaerae TaxID=1672749 RepID=A0A1Q9AQ55_9HYPH|nr:3-oxoadipate enol-lactonase [Xaviernesmea rhizosphaerae]OLP57554.1 3-oxoadipate enol-lactonase [Xaviernesmea rhizosphaerae]